MGGSWTRRAVTIGLATAGAGLSAGASRAAGGALPGEIARIEAGLGARLGVAVLDTGTGELVGHRTDERFPMCSTFKVLACGAALARVDAGRDELDRRIRFAAADLVPYSPITRDRVGRDGMTLAEICRAGADLQRQHGRQPRSREPRRAGCGDGVRAVARRRGSRGSIGPRPR